MRVLVCGGRDFGMSRGYALGSFKYDVDRERILAERSLFYATMNEHCPTGLEVIVHGAGKGADTLAERWAKRRGQEAMPFPANWYPNGRSAGLDRSAGPRRNQQMIDEGRPELVVAFPGGRGTADMVKRAKAANIKVIEVARPPEARE